MQKVLKKIYYLGENLANRHLGNTKKKSKREKYKKIEKLKKVPLMKTWHIGIMVAKKDSCQEGENLVNRRLLPFMLHLAAHLLS